MIGRSSDRMSRRSLVRASAALGAGTLALGASRGPAFAQPASPAATPDVSLSYARPDLLAAPGTIPEDHSLVALMSAATYAAGHIAVSSQIDWSTLNLADTSDAAIADWDGSVRAALAPIGALSAPVLAYDEGTLFAARLWWVLFYLGYPTAAVLNGGLPAWVAAGKPVVTGDTGLPAPLVATPAPESVPAVRRDALATLTDVEGILGNKNVVILDARAPSEYEAGHIPGAVNLEYTKNAASMSPPLWKPASELMEMYAAIGVTPDKKIVPYCSTGVRSAVTFFTLWLLGFPQVGLYTGSWQEWGANPKTPKTKGAEP
ncbi:MAG TPA: rhodanese-like domain-containing protein [Thermomicrobiales bacterium]|nr:rhodanese-like domain-containing protein [Thermomicrobiales bacterium]